MAENTNTTNEPDVPAQSQGEPGEFEPNADENPVVGSGVQFGAGTPEQVAEADQADEQDGEQDGKQDGEQPQG